MQHAVGQARETLQRHQLGLLERWFNRQTGEPVTELVRLPGGKVVHVPLSTLMPPGMLAIGELEMDFSVRVASSEVKPARDGRASFNVFFSGSGGPDGGAGSVKIRMRFKAVDELESAARARAPLRRHPAGGGRGVAARFERTRLNPRPLNAGLALAGKALI